MEVSFATYLSVTFVLLFALWLIRRKKRDEYYMDDKADLFIVIGSILFWPFIVSVLLIGIVLFICSLPILAVITIISWIVSLFKRDRHG